jgi:hypothetical protein
MQRAKFLTDFIGQTFCKDIYCQLNRVTWNPVHAETFLQISKVASNAFNRFFSTSEKYKTERSVEGNFFDYFFM